MTIKIGILLALLCAFASNLAFFYKQRGATRAPTVTFRHPLRSGAELFRSRWFAVGMAVALGAWLLHVAALALVPLSVVQIVLAGGVVLIGAMADRIFGFKVEGRQWAGLALTTAGLVALAATVPAAHGAHSAFSVPGMIAFESALFVVGLLLIVGPRAGAPAEHHGAMLGAAAGILFGVSDVAIKALTGIVAKHGALGLVSPWLAVALAASVVAFIASARGFQIGEAVPVIAVTGAAANIAAIAGGILVFGDPMPADVLGIVVESLGLVLVVCAAAVMPTASLRAARATA